LKIDLGSFLKQFSLVLELGQRGIVG